MLLLLEGIGNFELVTILLFILIFFGAKSIPGLSRSLGRTFRQIKDARESIQSEIKKSGLAMKDDLNLNRTLDQMQDDITSPIQKMANDIQSSVEGRVAQKSSPRDIMPKSPPQELMPKNNPTEVQDNSKPEKPEA